MNSEKARTILEKIKGRRVLVVGDIFLDTYLFCVIERANPEDAIAPLLRIQDTQYRTGGAGNVAKNLAMLGAQVTLLGAMGGNDQAGKELIATARKEGYQATLIPTEGRTINKTRVMVGNRLHSRIDDEKKSPLPDIDRKTEAQAIALLNGFLSEKLYDGIIISDYDKGFLTSSILEKTNSFWKKGVIGLGDMKPRRAPKVKGITMLSPNLSEGRQFLEIRPGEHVAPELVAKDLAEKFFSRIFLTCGAEGIQIAEPAQSGLAVSVPQEHRIQVADTSGCGDTVAAVILLATLAGATPPEAAKLANAAGAAVASSVGAIAPNKEEILTIFSQT